MLQSSQKGATMSAVAGLIDEGPPPVEPEPAIDIELLQRLRKAWRAEHARAVGLFQQVQAYGAQLARAAAVVAARQRDLEFAGLGFTPPANLPEHELRARANGHEQRQREARARHIERLRQQGADPAAIARAVADYDAQMRPALADYQAQLVRAERVLAEARQQETELIENHAHCAAIAGDLRGTLDEAERWLAANHPQLAEAA
jgi:hypothetical protein